MANTSKKSKLFTREEEEVMKECNHQSFWYRSLPLSIAFGIGVVLAVVKDYLKPNKNYGVFPKLFVAMSAGFILGKIVYAPQCIQNILTLKDSPVADELRRKGYK